MCVHFIKIKALIIFMITGFYPARLVSNRAITAIGSLYMLGQNATRVKMENRTVK